MANYTLSPSPFLKFFLADGVTPAANGRVYTSLAGFVGPATTYTTSSGVPNSNPIHLDGAGQAVIFLAPGSYAYAWYAAPTLPNDDQSGGLIGTQDNITSFSGIANNNTVPGIAGEPLTDGALCYLSDGSGGRTAGRWYLAQADNDYSSLTPELGFCIGGAPISGAVAEFLLSGQVTSGLLVTAGLSYYVSESTAGAITSVPPTRERKIGVADSGTSLIAFPNPPTTVGYDYIQLQTFG